MYSLIVQSFIKQIIINSMRCQMLVICIYNKVQLAKMHLKTQQSKKQNGPVYHVKGLSWMLKANSSATSTVKSNASSIDQNFKVFKLKDEKKKWKKKINKKFQGVGVQIQAVMRNSFHFKQPFDIGFKQQSQNYRVPHLKNLKKFDQYGNFVGLQQIDFESRLQSSKIQAFKDKMSKFKESKQIAGKRYSLQQQDKQNMHRQIFGLGKKLSVIKRSNIKVMQTKHLLCIHSKQKALIDQQNQEFFQRQLNWINNISEEYKHFDIEQHQKALINNYLSQGNF